MFLIVSHVPQTYLLSERSFGEFERAIELPKGTKAESIEASTVDNVLTVRVPRVHAGEMRAQIPIRLESTKPAEQIEQKPSPAPANVDV